MTDYPYGMDLPFTKLRAAGDAWILIDRRDAPMKDADFAAIARALCHRVKGAGAAGLILLEQSRQALIARSWSRKGAVQALPPTAALCTARWLFDTGNLSGDAIHIRTLEGAQEVLVLDSRIFSVCLGKPVAGKIRRGGEDARLGADSGLLKNYIGVSSVATGPSERRVMLWDGPLPKRRLRAAVDKRGSEQPPVYAGILSRGRIEVYAPGDDALSACAAALAAARAGDFCEQEANCSGGDGFTLAYVAGDDSVFAAGSVSYCLRGEWWYED